MHHVRPRWHVRLGRWYASVGDRDETGRRKEVFAPVTLARNDEPGAWQWMAAEIAKRATSAPVDRSSVETLAEHYLAWAEEQRDEGKLAVAHYASKRHHLRIFCLAHGRKPVSSLSADAMSDWLSSMVGRYAPNYVANIGATISTCLHWGVRNKVIAANPCEGFSTPVVPKGPERFAERAEAAAFLWAWRRHSEGVGPTQRRFERLTILLQRCLMRTGARPGELCVLRWHDVKWSGHTSSTGHKCAKAVIPPDRWKAGKKTGKPRTIYFSPALTRALRREHARPDRHEGFVFVHGRGRGGIGAGQAWEDGSRLSKTVTRARRRAMELSNELRARAEAGEELLGAERRFARVVLLDEGPNRVTNYRWRHTAISTLLMMGVDVPTVAELTGTSAEMIHRVYGHLLDSHLRNAAEKLSRSRKLG